MGRYGVSVVAVFMTTFTDLHSHSAITPTYFCGRKNSSQEEKKKKKGKKD
jgi:hypothetical protein